MSQNLHVDDDRARAIWDISDLRLILVMVVSCGVEGSIQEWKNKQARASKASNH
jgi:hypothetical protein